MPITAIERVLYTAEAHTTGGREGVSSLTSINGNEVRFLPKKECQ